MKYTGQQWHQFCDTIREADRQMDRIARPRRCAQCWERQARPTSIYCSEQCRKQFVASLQESK